MRKLNVLCLSFSFNNLLYFNVDDLDRAHASLELYFKTIELVELGKRPPRDNSDIASEVDTGIVTGRGCRERKARKVYDPTASPTHKNKKTSGCDLSKTTPAEAVKRTCDKTFENGTGQVDEQTKKDFHTESMFQLRPQLGILWLQRQKERMYESPTQRCQLQKNIVWVMEHYITRLLHGREQLSIVNFYYYQELMTIFHLNLMMTTCRYNVI